VHAAGIDVLSTVNVQHLESLNDVVERITGVRQKETVPDEVVRRAEQVELVDITREALRRRLAHGNIYTARTIDAALANYFRPGNLTALRELALLWVADQVDEALRRYRAEKQITDTWEARERVVAAITAGPESETLIRRASRIALRAGAELLVLTVLRGDGLTGLAPQEIARFRKLAEDLGATFHTVVGEDVPTALLDFARGANATQLVLGTSRRSRFARLFDEGIGSAVVQASGPIDVHMVTHEEASRGWRVRLSFGSVPATRRMLGFLLAVLGPAATAWVGVLLRSDLSVSTVVVAYFLFVVLVAMLGGLWPALLAAALCGGLFNFFFTEPYHTLIIADGENVVTLVAMVIVAVLVALVVDRASRRSEQAARARTEASLLASYARTVLTDPEPLTRLLEKVRENFGMSSVAMLEKQDGRWRQVACIGEPGCAGPDEADVDIPVTLEVHLALRGRALPAGDRTVLEDAAGQALLTLRHQRVMGEAEQARREAEAIKLRTALLSAVGHDLRTPLTSIRAAADSLRTPDIELSTRDQDELLATIDESTNRLTGLIDNLLDSSRLSAGAVQPQIRPVGYDEVVARALSNMDESHRIAVDVPENLPHVLADPGLLERVVANVVDNAFRHGVLPTPRPVDVDGDGRISEDEPVVAIRGSSYADQVELRIVDHGKGAPKRAIESVFTPFQRKGDRDTTTGVGLGLSVARGFIEAMDGTIRPEETPGGGLTVVISLPARYIAEAGSGTERTANYLT
jgi:two-component system, OmpR family, sensor histidine kinase KdpD